MPIANDFILPFFQALCFSMPASVVAMQPLLMHPRLQSAVVMSCTAPWRAHWRRRGLVVEKLEYASEIPYGSTAKMRAGAPVPLSIFIGMQKIVAPLNGSLSALARFSNPTRLAPSHIRWTGKSLELP